MIPITRWFVPENRLSKRPLPQILPAAKRTQEPEFSRRRRTPPAISIVSTKFEQKLVCLYLRSRSEMEAPASVTKLGPLPPQPTTRLSASSMGGRVAPSALFGQTPKKGEQFKNRSPKARRLSCAGAGKNSAERSSYQLIGHCGRIRAPSP